MDAATAADEDIIADLRAHLEAGGTLGEWSEVGPSELAAAHALAHYFYGLDQYDTAAQLFLWLIAMAPHDRQYQLGIAAVRKMQGRYVEAVDYYIAALALDVEDASAAFYLAECLLHLGLRDQARDMFEMSIHYAQPDQAEMRKKALAFLTLLGAQPAAGSAANGGRS